MMPPAQLDTDSIAMACPASSVEVTTPSQSGWSEAQNGAIAHAVEVAVRVRPLR